MGETNSLGRLCVLRKLQPTFAHGYNSNANFAGTNALSSNVHVEIPIYIHNYLKVTSLKMSKFGKCKEVETIHEFREPQENILRYLKYFEVAQIFLSILQYFFMITNDI